MANWVHRTDKTYLHSVEPNELPEAEANYIENPDLSAVAGWSNKYWAITGDVVSLMSPAERDAVDAAELASSRDSLADRVSNIEDVLRASLLAILDEVNLHAIRINAILDGIDNASNLAEVKTAIALINDVPSRTIAQMKTAIRGKLGS
jgi:hypothetical protein